jgi:hypothetical protein
MKGNILTCIYIYIDTLKYIYIYTYIYINICVYNFNVFMIGGICKYIYEVYTYICFVLLWYERQQFRIITKIQFNSLYTRLVHLLVIYFLLLIFFRTYAFLTVRNGNRWYRFFGTLVCNLNKHHHHYTRCSINKHYSCYYWHTISRYIYIHIYIYIYTYINISLYVNLYIMYMCTYIYLGIIRLENPSMNPTFPGLGSPGFALGVSPGIYICIYIYVYIYIGRYVDKYRYVYSYICTYIHIHIYTFYVYILRFGLTGIRLWGIPRYI